MLVASPVVATLFSEGLKHGGMWTGLPFLFAGLLFVMATGAMWVTDFNGPTIAEQEDKLRAQKEMQWEQEDLEEEKQGLRRSPSPRTPPFRLKFEHSPNSKPSISKHVPTPLVLAEREQRAKIVKLRMPSYLETPLFSPGLQIMESRGGF